MASQPLFSQEQLDFMAEHYPSMTVRELTPVFNARFATGFIENQIKSAISRNKILSGRTGYFKKGESPWNAGVKGSIKVNAGSFKKGNIPHNKNPLWTERVGKDGYIELSVPEPNPYTGFPTRYKYKHVWLWEQAHGKKPRGTAVIFKDSDTRNFNLDNLLLVTRAELLSMNLHDYKNHPQELKPAVLALAKLEAKAGIRISQAERRGRAIINSESGTQNGQQR